MAKQLAHDYYRVDVPQEFGTEEERGEQAIHEARERARLFCLPALWRVLRIEGDALVVCRVRHKRAG